MNSRVDAFEAPGRAACASAFAQGVVSEVQALAQALWSPQHLIDEVLAMRVLFDEAARIEAQDPAGAAELRRRAAAMCAR
jgi:hypothetical protein